MSLTLYSHPFAMYCWKPLIALHERGLAFEPKLVEDRAEVAALWPPAAIPLLVDDGTVIPESSTIVEYLDRRGDAKPMLPAGREPALQARIWDRVMDGYVTTPVQKIVGDALRSPDSKDPQSVDQAHAALDLAYAMLERQLDGRGRDGWLAGEEFTLADCSALPAMHYADVLHELDRSAYPQLGAYYDRLLRRPSVGRVIDEARPYRSAFPLPWPAHVA
jgi:glutathione S-transferase